MISDKAYVDPSARIGDNVTIHPFAFIDADTVIGDNSVIYPFASVMRGTTTGKNCRIFQGAVAGAQPQDFRWKGTESFCTIGDNVTIREHAIINGGFNSKTGTFIGSDTFIMAEAHIGHDSRVEGCCIIGNGVNIAGGITIEKYVILSSNVIIYEDSHIGEWAFIKGGCRINGNVPPYVIMAHNPVIYFGVNAHIMKKEAENGGFTDEIIDDVAKAYRHLYQSGTSVFNAMKRIEADVDPSPQRDKIIDFIKTSNMKVVAIPLDLE